MATPMTTGMTQGNAKPAGMPTQTTTVADMNNTGKPQGTAALPSQKGTNGEDAQQGTGQVALDNASAGSPPPIIDPTVSGKK